MTTIFPTAATLRAQKQTSTTVHSEVLLLENAVLASSEAGNLTVTISDSNFTTPGLTAQSYYSVWKDLTTDLVKDLEMDTVISYFAGKGYSINRITNTATNNTFSWVISW
jgi:hypothetical protein